MKRVKMSAACVALAGSIVLSSCIGSFSLTNRVLDWNKELTGNKFVNEVVFFAMHIVPVYGITILADAVVLNSIEFWTGNDALAEGTVKEVKGEDGNYIVTTTKDGYTINKEGEDEAIDLTFNKENQSWNVTFEGETYELLKMNGNGTVDLNLQNGSYMNLNLDATGIMAARQAAMGSMYVAR